MTNQLFFDFDGTIANSEQGIVNAIKYMVDQLNLPHLTDTEYRTFIGPTLTSSLNRYFPELTENQVITGVKAYQESYGDTGMFEMTLYPNIEHTLTQLKDAGFRLNVASTKTETVLTDVVEHFKLGHYFEGLYGATIDERDRSSKSAILAYGMQQSGAMANHTIMIGDRYTDMNGGTDNQVKTLGVTYGFGDAAELRAAEATAIVTTPLEIPDAVAELLR